MIRIIIPLDGSKVAEIALEHAASIAQAFPAELMLLRIIGEPHEDSTTRDSIDLALWRHQAQAYLNGLVEKYSCETLSLHTEVIEGNPAESILQFAEKSNPDLIVISRYGKGNAMSFATGGTAQKVISNAPCSVLLLDPDRHLHTDNRYHRILVPLDESKNSECALAIATMIAEVNEASLMLLYVTGESQVPTGLPKTQEAQHLIDEMHRLVRQEATQRVAVLAAKIPKYVSVDTRVIVSADPSLAIESTAQEQHSDVIILHTSDSDPEVNHRHESINQLLIQYSHRPLFILKPTAADGFVSNFRSVFLKESCLEAS